jgi:sulfonate dioxygenase
LNVNLGFVTGFAELKKAESDALLQFLKLHIHSADDHYVRWKWEVGSVALWDNVSQSVLSSSYHSPLVFFHEEQSMIEGSMARDRTGIQRVGLRWDQRLICIQRVTVHRVIPGNYPADSRSGIRTTVFGEKRMSPFPLKYALTY